MQKSISSFLVFLLCFSLFCEQSCLALMLPPSHLPPPTGSEKKIQLELSDGQEKLESAGSANKIAAINPIAPDQLKQLLNHLPAQSKTSASSSFKIPPAPTAPAKPGGTTKQEFPPKESKTRPASKSPAGALKVLHYTPEKAVSEVKQISITFSQPMVPLSSAESNAEAKNIPVKMTPDTAGHWRWLGTQTLAFIPKGKILPRSTNYHLEIPAGTSSLSGNKLAQTISWDINTPCVQAQSMIPADGAKSISLKPVIFAIFDQKVEPADVLKTITLSQAGAAVPVRIASADEIKKDAEIAEQVKVAPKNRWLAFVPDKQLQKAQKVSVKFGPNTPSKEGPAKSKSSQVFSFETYGPLIIEPDYERNAYSQDIYLRLSNQIDPAKFNSKMVSISPAVPNARISASDGIYIEGLKANTKYTITLSRAIRDIYGQTLSGTNIATIKTAENSAQLSEPPDSMAIIQKNKQSYYSVLSQNAKQLKVCLYSCKPEDFSKYLQQTSKYRAWHETPQQYPEFQKFNKISEQIISPAKNSTLTESRIELKPYFKDGANNVIATVEVLPRKKDDVRRFPIWIQSTNIGLDAFIDGRSLIVMASRLDTGAPISGATITLTDAKKTASTDQDGLARFQFTDERYAECIVCKSGDDQSFYSLLSSNTTYTELPSTDLPMTSTARRDALRWYCVTDRNLYKPGEKVQAKGWMRLFTAGPEGDLQLVKSTNSTIEYKITDATGVELGKGTTKVDESGGFDLSMDIPKNANLGDANISLSPRVPQRMDLVVSNGNCTFKIAEFRRPEFELSVKQDSSNALILGDTASLTANAKYFAGGVLSDAPISWDVSTSSSQYSPPGWSEFSFGKGAGIISYFRYPGEFNDENVTQETRKGQTDSSGKHTLRIQIKKIANAVPVSIKAQASVEDVNRQQWSDSSTLLLHPASDYVGVKTDKQMYRANEPLKISTIVTDIDGKSIQSRNVHLDVYTETTEYKDDGSYEIKKTILASREFKSEAKAVETEIPISSGGLLNVLATISDNKGRKNETTISIWKEEKIEKKIDHAEQEKVILIPDHKEYQPGQNTSIMIQAPFKPARGIVSIRHNGMLKTVPVELKDGSSIIELPVSEQMMPNAYVQANLVGPNSKFASGVIMLSVPPDSRKLKVEITPAEKNISPGQKTSVKLNVSRQTGGLAPNAHLAVAIVDESVLALSGYSWQDPASAFYLGAVTDTIDLHNRQFVVLPSQPDSSPPASLPPPKSGTIPAPAGAVGAGGAGADKAFSRAPMRMKATDEAPMLQGATNGTIGPSDANFYSEGEAKPISLRTDFSAVAYFNPNLITDDKGNVSFDFQAPDNLTRYRIMAVAVEGEQMCGKGESAITARLPLMVKPSAPRFLNFGDKCEFPVVVQNQTDHELAVELGLRASNLIFDLPGAGADSSTQGNSTCGASVLVPPNDRVEVRFPAHTDRDGEASIDIAASSKEASDAASVNLPVYTPATSQAFADYGQIDSVGAAEEIVELPPDVYDQVGGVEISTSSTAMQSLADAYFYVRDYQFMCSEQLSSRVLSMLALQDFLYAFKKLSADELQKSKTEIEKDIAELAKRQNPDGSFGLWKRGEQSQWPFLAVQVTRAIIEARTAGNISYPEPVLQNATNYLLNIDKTLNPKEYDEISKRSITAYALFVLQLAKKPYPKKAASIVQSCLTQTVPARKSKDSLPHLSDIELLNRNLSVEAMAWLLPVVSSDKQYGKEAALLRSAISSHIGETAEHASVNDEPYGLFGYRFFYSPTRQEAAVLESMIMDQPDSDLIPKLAKGLLMQRKAGRWESTQENSAVLLALSKYFHTYEKLEPHLNVQTWIGNAFAGETAYSGRSTETNILNVPMSYLLQHPDAKDLLLNKTGQGRLYYRIALNYAPKNLALAAFDNGFTVERTYEAAENPADVKRDANGVWHIKAGATVKAKITMSASSRRCHVALTDPLPAGMEPINTELKGNKEISEKQTTPPSSADGSDDSEASGAANSRTVWDYFPWWRSSWYEHQNLRDFRAEAFTSVLYGGKYEYNYLMRATTPGDYIAPPAKAEEMYSPEISGRSSSDHVIVE